MAFTCDYGQRKRKYETQNLKREIELDEECVFDERENKQLNGRL